MWPPSLLLPGMRPGRREPRRTGAARRPASLRRRTGVRGDTEARSLDTGYRAARAPPARLQLWRVERAAAEALVRAALVAALVGPPIALGVRGLRRGSLTSPGIVVAVAGERRA